MNTDALYTTFTHPKVVSSMLVFGIGLGLILSVLVRFFSGQWFLPVAFVVLSLGIVVLYLAWLDRQDFRDDIAAALTEDSMQNAGPSIMFSARKPGFTGPPTKYALFTNRRMITSIFLLSTGLGTGVCILILLFRGTWYLPALFTALTVGTVALYLVWLDGADFSGN